MTLRSQVLAGLKWTVLGRLSSQVVTWAITIYVIRLLSPEDYGLMALEAIFSALFALVAEIGLGPTLVLLMLVWSWSYRSSRFNLFPLHLLLCLVLY